MLILDLPISRLINPGCRQKAFRPKACLHGRKFPTRSDFFPLIELEDFHLEDQALRIHES